MEIKIKKKLLLAVLFSTCFMVFLLYRVEWEEFRLIAVRLNIKYLAFALLVFLLGNLIRAFRFNKLDHTGKKLIYWWNVNGFYNFITATLPGGSGEAASIYLLKKFSDFNLLSALRILLLSRLLDLFAISLLFLIAAVRIGSAAHFSEVAMWLSGVLFVVSSAALIPASEQFVMRLLQHLPGRNLLVKKIYEKLSELLIISKEQRTNHSFAITTGQSILMISSAVISTHLVLRSFGVDFTLIQSMYCFGVYAVFQAVPVQGIAGIGTQAAWWALALNAAGYRGADSVALGLVLHGTFYVFIGAIGLSALVISFVNKRCN